LLNAKLTAAPNN